MDELSLFETKWFDYRLLRPDVATLVFISEWNKAMKAYNVKIGLSSHVYLLKGFSFKSITTAQENWRWKHFDKIRQWCDCHGLKYNSFWSTCISTGYRRGFKMWVPVIAGNKKLLNCVKDELDSLKSSGIIETSQSSFFFASNYISNQIQNDYYHYLFYSCRKKYGSKMIHAMVRLVNEGLISRRYFTNCHTSKINHHLIDLILSKTGGQ